MNVRYTSPAASELAAVLDYLAERSPQGARRVLERFLALEQMLALFPECGEPTRIPWLRRISAAPMPYSLFYEIAASGVIIHRVRHNARRPASPEQ